MLRVQGRWRITVVTRSADFEQRVVVRTSWGRQVLAGNPGATLEVDDESWVLSLEHNVFNQGTWRENVRTAVAVGEQNGVRTQVLNSTDAHLAGHDPNRVNFVVRLDQAVAQAPQRQMQQRRAAVAPTAALSAPTRSITTSSSSADDYGILPAPSITASAPTTRERHVTTER